MPQTADPAAIVGATLRVTVQAPRRRLDLVVPSWFGAHDLAGTVADELALDDVPDLLDAAGRPLPTGRTLEEAGMRHGAIVVVAPSGPAPRQALDDERAVPGGSGEQVTAEPPVWISSWAVDLAAVAVVVGAVSAALGDDVTLRRVVVALLLLLAVAALLPGGPASLRTQRRHLVPWCLGGAALAAVGTSAEHPLLPVAVAGLGAVAAAGVLRAATDDHVVSLVWLWGAGAFAAVATVLLVLGAGPPGLWSTLLVLGLVVVRLLPTIVVDVPDDVLLDLERLAVTAWSARDDQPRGQRRRRVVRRGEVVSLARHGGALLRSGTAGAALVLVASAVLLLRSDAGLEPWAVIGGQVQVGLAAAVMALLGRSYRDWRLQALLRVAAAAMLLALAADVGAGLSPVASVPLVAGTAAVAAGVVAAAVALGRGWRSVWWARVADLGQGLLFATAMALLPLASGLFDHVWRFTS